MMFKVQTRIVRMEAMQRLGVSQDQTLKSRTTNCAETGSSIPVVQIMHECQFVDQQGNPESYMFVDNVYGIPANSMIAISALK